ncbi:hypothetical protein BDV12DRAFT_188109 [Aspergillus spectabilis]
MPIYPNSVLRRWSEQALCRAFGIRLVTSPAIVQLAKNAGFDALFIELEHSTLTLNDASQLCTAALLANLTPLVRVPYQCGDGFVQRVLDGGAMGVIFPHIHDADDAKAAVRISKYPPQGTRSMTGQLPQFNLAPTPIPTVTEESNASGSTVFVMIETKSSIENIGEIASVPGVDVLLTRSNDLSIELGVPGDFRSEAFRAALEMVSEAAKKYGKGWAVGELGVRWILGQQDSGILARGAKGCLDELAHLL